MEVTTIGIDLAKSVFAVCGADSSGRIVLRKQLRRAQMLGFFGRLKPCVIGLEACGGAHWSYPVSVDGLGLGDPFRL